VNASAEKSAEAFVFSASIMDWLRPGAWLYLRTVWSRRTASGGHVLQRFVLLVLLTAASQASAARHAHSEATPHATITSDHTEGDVREVVLSNGLKILLKEDHAAPVATFVVYYKVGSRNEYTGITGSSHLLEHLQFKGTHKYVGKAAVWGGLSHVGASFNATTSNDRTNYYETVPIEQLPFAIDLEADRMRNSTFSDEDRASEMTVVRNELERGENEPGRLLSQLTWATSFISHPYHHPVIGWRSDVENVPTSQLRSYYNTYYQPDNAVAVAVGDFKTQQVLDLIVAKFGVHPGGHQFPSVYTTEEKQRGERRVQIQKPGEIALVTLGWHLPAIGSPDIVPLKVLQLVLSGELDLSEAGDPLDSGISNRLYQALVEKEIATGVGMSYRLMLYESLGSITASLRPGVPHWKAEDAIRAELLRLKTEPVTAEELKRAKSRARAAFALGQEGTFGQALTLGSFGLLGDWRIAREFADKVETVTAADLQRVARAYFTEEGTTVAWFVPQSAPAPQPQPPPAKKAERDAVHAPAYATLRDTDDAAEAQGVTARALAAADGGGGAAVTQPTIQKKTLSNGLRIVVQENHSNPTFSLSGAILAGSVHETPAEVGLAGVTADLMERGTQKHSKLGLAAVLEDVGAAFGLGDGFEWIPVYGLARKDDLDRVLDVMSEELLLPAFPVDELKKSVAERVASVKQAEDSTRVKGRRALMQALYSKDSPFYTPDPQDEIASLQSITPERVRKWYETYYGPDRTVLVIVGDVKAEEIFSKLEARLGAWKKVGGPTVDAPPAAQNPAPKRIEVSMPDKSNVDILEGVQGTIRRTDPEFYPAMLANYILGGSVSGRLFAQIRNEMGLTYGINSGLSAGKLAGPWTISLTVNPKVIDKAIDAVKTVVAKWTESGVTAQELADAKTEIAGLYKVSLGNNRGLASVMTQYEVLGLGAEFVREHPKRILAVTREQVNAAIKQSFHPDKLVTVISGTLPEAKTP
jgi:zinc protease